MMGLVFLGEGDFPAHDFGGRNAAAGAVDAQDDGFDVLVLAQLAQLPRDAIAADLAGAALATDNASICLSPPCVTF